jgi:threonine dehydratase
LKAHTLVPIKNILAAQKRIKDVAVRTPLIRLNVDNISAQIYLKLENLQPTNSFKIRGASNAIQNANNRDIAKGVWTASAGNMALAVAWYAREIGVHSTVFVSDLVPDSKLERLRKLDCKVMKVPFADWFEIIKTHRYQGMEGVFVHPVSDAKVMAGNGTIGLEIIEDMPDVAAIVIPFGLGGLCCGIGSALRVIKPEVKLYACETEAAAPFSASLGAGKIVDVGYNPSFVDAMGAPTLLPEMWPLASRLVNDSLVSSLEDIAAAIKILIEQNRIVAEGGGAAAVAAALSGKAGTGKIVCVVSGGNIDTDKLEKILNGNVP